MRCPQLGRRSEIAWILGLLLLLTSVGCSSTPGDPLEKINRPIYKFNDGFDRYALKPATDFYVKVIPLPVRTAIGKAINNLAYPNVILNDFLQAKWKQGFSDTGRMAVNTTVGLLGFFDPATNWGMPLHYNQTGTTLRKWGVGPGPYVVVPIFGPTTATDASNYVTLWYTDPLYWLRPGWKVTVPIAVVATLDGRSRVDVALRFRNQNALDPYVFTRDAYLQYRNNEVWGGGGPPQPTSQDIFTEDLDEMAVPTTKPKE